jgi:hypothetical protein
MNVEAHHSLDVPKDVFQHHLVDIPRCMHVETDLLRDLCNAWMFDR